MKTCEVQLSFAADRSPSPIATGATVFSNDAKFDFDFAIDGAPDGYKATAATVTVMVGKDTTTYDLDPSGLVWTVPAEVLTYRGLVIAEIVLTDASGESNVQRFRFDVCGALGGGAEPFHGLAQPTLEDAVKKVLVDNPDLTGNGMQGPVGPVGPQGPPGEKGDAGADGKDDMTSDAIADLLASETTGITDAIKSYVDQQLADVESAVIKATNITAKDGYSLSLSVGKTFQVTPVLTPSNTSEPVYYYYYGDSSTIIASVDNNGLVTALAPGSGHIYLSTQKATAEQIYKLDAYVRGLVPIYGVNLTVTSAAASEVANQRK